MLLGGALNAEICEDLSDMLPDGMSPLTSLFQEGGKMKAYFYEAFILNRYQTLWFFFYRYGMILSNDLKKSKL